MRGSIYLFNFTGRINIKDYNKHLIKTVKKVIVDVDKPKIVKNTSVYSRMDTETIL
jgi:hypothetical protein